MALIESQKPKDLGATLQIMNIARRAMENPQRLRDRSDDALLVVANLETRRLHIFVDRSQARDSTCPGGR
jgi:hypothetical protein